MIPVHALRNVVYRDIVPPDLSKVISAQRSQPATLQGQTNIEGTLRIYCKINESHYSKHLVQSRTVQKVVGIELCDPWEREVFQTLLNCLLLWLMRILVLNNCFGIVRWVCTHPGQRGQRKLVASLPLPISQEQWSHVPAGTIALQCQNVWVLLPVLFLPPPCSTAIMLKTGYIIRHPNTFKPIVIDIYVRNSSRACCYREIINNWVMWCSNIAP